MEHPGGRSSSGRGSGRARPRTIRGGRATPTAPYGGRGLSSSPEVPLFDFSSSPSGYLSSSPSLYTSSSPAATPPDAQQGGPQHTASPQSHVGEEGSSSEVPIWGSRDPETGFLWIRPDGNEFLPDTPVATFMSDQIFRNYTQAWTAWTEIPKKQRDTWFKEFLDKHMTLPEHLENLKKAYNHRASVMVRRKLYALRRSRGKTDWLPQDTRDELFGNWENNDKFKTISAKNKQNRAKMEGPSYAGGSISISEHRRKVVESGEAPAGSVEWVTFQRTHSRQPEGSERQWINPRAQQIAENFEKLSQERATQRETDPSSSISDNESLFFEATGGFDKKGRVFGYGESASRLKQTKRLSSGTVGVCSDELKKMKALVEEQATQMTQEREMMSQRLTQETEMMRQQMIQEQDQIKQALQQEKDQIKQALQQERAVMRQEMTQQNELMRVMQLQIMSLMKDRGSGSTPGDDEHAGDDDDHNAAV